MRPVEELINLDEPGIELVKEWLSNAENHYEILPPSNEREQCLYETQVSTRSPMGAIVYDTGGILVDHGWLRFLGSGHEKLKRDLPGWNKRVLGDNKGLYMIADDVLGGFFAINGGVLGSDTGKLYYLAYDDTDWEPLEIGYSEFFDWSLSGKLADFYGEDRWDGWEQEVSQLHGDQYYNFYPFLWSEEGNVNRSHRKAISIEEGFNLKMEFIRQLEA